MTTTHTAAIVHDRGWAKIGTRTCSSRATETRIGTRRHAHVYALSLPLTGTRRHSDSAVYWYTRRRRTVLWSR